MGTTALDELRIALALAVTQGAALGMVAGCAGRSERAGGNEGGRSGTAGALSTGGSTPQGGTSAVGGVPGLQPYPLDDVGCFGPSFDGGYDGQCCTSAHCYTPAEGGCVSADEPPPIPLPPGSGTCGCSTGQGQNDAVRGPYAPNPNGMPLEDGMCCYLVGSISCEGRPLVVAGAAIVAPLVRRSDWCAALA